MSPGAPWKINSQGQRATFIVPLAISIRLTILCSKDLEHSEIYALGNWQKKAPAFSRSPVEPLSLPSNRLSEDLHACSVASVGPGGVHNAVGTRRDLRVVTEKSASWEPYTGIEGGRADR